MRTIDGKNCFDSDETSARLGVTKRTISTYIRQGLLKALKLVGEKKYYITEDSIAELEKPKEVN